jgi:hypothetical protein
VEGDVRLCISCGYGVDLASYRLEHSVVILNSAIRVLLISAFHLPNLKLLNLLLKMGVMQCLGRNKHSLSSFIFNPACWQRVN